MNADQFKETDKERVSFHEVKPGADAVRGSELCHASGIRFGDDHNVQIWSVNGRDDLFFKFERPTEDGKVSVLAFPITREGAEALHLLLTHKLSLRSSTQNEGESLNAPKEPKGTEGAQPASASDPTASRQTGNQS